MCSFEIPLVEMPRSGSDSFCCGAGGAQMWKEEEPGDQRVSEARIAEAKATGQSIIAVGCPYCMIMLSDAAGPDSEMQIKDVAEVLVEQVRTGDLSI